MSNSERLFKTPDNTVSYISDTQHFGSRGYRTGVVQADIGTGDVVSLEGRISNSMNWLEILSISTQSSISEVVLAPQMRVTVTNQSGGPIVVMITE
jgi:hypothetical protein